MNIAEILKDAPKGTELYSPLLGVVTLKEIIKDACYSIKVVDKCGQKHLFTSDGRFYEIYKNAECLLFPSKENRDWSTFKVEPQFPNTIDESSKLLDLSVDDEDWYKEDKIGALRKLLIARDAWWKVDHNWKPNWRDNQDISVINNHFESIVIGECARTSFILAFRTEDIAVKFLKTFGDLIEECKELL